MELAPIAQDAELSQNDGPRKQDHFLLYSAIVVAAGILATTLGQPQMLARLPLQNLLKNELHVDRSANAAFFFWIGLAWYFKPIVGVVTDALPFFGSRRKTYMLVASVLSTLAWVGLIFTPHQYNKLLWMCMVLDIFMVVTSTVVGGYMVEVAQRSAGSGRLTAVRNFMEQMSYIILGPVAGVLSSIAFGWTAGSCGLATFILVPAAIFFLHEKRIRLSSRELVENAGRQMVKIVGAKTMWAAAGLMALFYFAPGIQTALFYRQQNLLHMDTNTQGFLIFLSGIGGVTASLLYGFACKRLKLRTLLFLCLTIATAANISYVAYTSLHRAELIDSLNGWGYTLAELVLMDLAVRSTPAGSEGLGFALMMAVRNAALFGTDWFGSSLMDHHHVTFNMLVITNSVTTLATVPLVLLLPMAIVGYRDAETSANEKFGEPTPVV